MATIIDSLLVTLGMDSKDFDAKNAKVDKGLKQTEKSAENVTKTLVKFMAILGGTTAIKRFVEQTIDSNAALERFSKNLGESVNNISAWSNAAERAGGTAEGLQGTMDMLSKSQTELMLTGQSGLIPYFSALGIAMSDAQGQARPVSDMLLDMSERFSTMDRTTANNMGRMMGIDQGTMNLLLKGRQEVETIIARQKEFAAVTKKQAEESARLRERIVDSAQTFKAFGRELLSSAAPAIEKVFNLFEQFGAWVRDNSEFVKAFLAIVAGGLIAIGVALTPINLVVVAVGLLAAGFALLYDDYKAWADGAKSLFDWTNFAKVINVVKDAFKDLRDILRDEVFYRAFALIDGVTKLLSGDDNGARIAFNEMIAGGDGGSAPAAPPPQKPSSGSKGRLSNLEKKYGLPEGLLDNVWLTESGRGKNMKSPAGAEGHFQFMPATAKQYGLKNPYDFDESSDAAARYYRDLLKANNGDLPSALAAYNWGQGNLNRKGMANAPRETRNYISKIMGGISGASQAAAGAGAGKVAMANNPGLAQNNGMNVETNINEIKVYTAATDAEGIAKDMGKSMEYLFASQANYGVS